MVIRIGLSFVHLGNRNLARPVRLCKEFAARIMPTLFKPADVNGGKRRTAMLAKFFNAIWGWADYRPKDWSNAPYKRGYAS